MNFHIITIFPEIFSAQGGPASGGNSCYFNKSILGRAQKNKIIKIKTHDLRKYTKNKHKKVDDTPYGGGAGMVMQVEPIYRALSELKSKVKSPSNSAGRQKSKVILLSAKGKKWDQRMANKYSKLNNIILICGRYEGVDERVKKFVDEEISIGDYVLTGGEIPAMIIVDSITRLLPGSLGNARSAEKESHSEPGILEHPHYTKPEVFTVEHKTENTEQGVIEKKQKKSKIENRKSKITKLRVPKVLLSGNHKKIEEWRKKHSKKV